MAAATESKELFRFSVPAGEALVTLKLAAEQCEIDLLYSSQVVKNIQTANLQGAYNIEEAFKVLLLNTGLALYEDSNSGTYAIVVSEGDLSVNSTDDTVKIDQPNSNQNPEMKQNSQSINTDRRSFLSRTLAVMGILGTAIISPAQDDMEDEDILLLSPFVVETSENTYVATSTLAGTRIRTDVADVGAPISILTNQLITDVGGTDAETLLNIVGNVEVSGAFGNFSAASDVNVGSDNHANVSSTRESTTATQRVRGLVNAQLTRNYFQTIIPFDTYNVSQVTVNRGPNSVLFGLGSPGGVIESSILQPGYKNVSELQLRFDNFGGHRQVLNVNRQFFDNRLGLRVALLNEDTQYRQEEAFEEDQRAFITWSAKLRDADQDAFLGDTTFRGHFETGEIDKNPPDIIPPVLNYRFYWDVSEVQKLIGNYPGINSMEDLLAFNNGGLAKYIPTSQGGTWEPRATIDNLDSSTRIVETSAPGFLYGHLVYPDVNADTNLYGFDGVTPRVRWAAPRRTQDSLWTTSTWGNGLNGFRNPTLTDRNVFDYVEHLYSGDTDTMTDDFDVMEFTLEQEFLGGDLGVELSYNKQEMESYRYNPYSDEAGVRVTARAVAIDISELVPITEEVPSPSGDITAPLRSNPNIGRPALRQIEYHQSWVEQEQEVLRATAFFQHDFRESLGEKWGKWVGRHIVSGLFQNYENTFLRREEALNWVSQSVNLGDFDIYNDVLNDFRHKVASWVYVGDSVLNASGPQDVRLDFPLTRAVLPVVGQPYDLVYYDTGRRTDVGDSGIKVANDATPTWVPHHNSGISRQEVDSEAFIWQSYWLDEHFVTLFAWRDDEVSNFEIIPEGRGNAGRRPDGSYDLSLRVLQDEPSFSQKGSTFTKSFVLKFPEKYLFELPFDSDFRVHYFESETFQPSGIARDINASVLSNPNGNTEEYGFSLDMFNRRLSMTVNWFETGNNATRWGRGVPGTNLVGTSSISWLARAWDWENSGGEVTEIPGAAEAGFTTWEQYYDAIIGVTPAAYAALVDTQFNRDTGEITQTPIEGLNSTFDFVAEGIEFEISGAITDNWNVWLNVSKQETVQSNTLPGVLEWQLELRDNLDAAGLTNVAQAPALGETATFGDTLETEIRTVRNERAKDGQRSSEQRKWRWNLISSYSFDEGPLSGATVGAVGRWQDKVAIGFPTILDESGNFVNDVSNPYFGDSEFNMDVWVSYVRPILDGKVDWKVQLNVRNLVGGDPDDLIPVYANPLGDVDVYRTSPERIILLTNTFTF